MVVFDFAGVPQKGQARIFAKMCASFELFPELQRREGYWAHLVLLVAMAPDLAHVAEAHQIWTHQCRMPRVFQITDVFILAELILPCALGVGV